MEIMREGRQAPDGLEPVVGGGLYVRIIFRDQEAGSDILHVDVLEEEAAHIMAAVAVGRDADALVGAFEAVSPDVLGAPSQFAADGQAMAVPEDAIRNEDSSAAGIVRSR